MSASAMHQRIEFEPHRMNETEVEDRMLIEFLDAASSRQFFLERIGDEVLVHVAGYGSPFRLRSVKFLADMRRSYFDLVRNADLSRVAVNFSLVESHNDIARSLANFLKGSSATWFHRERA